MTIIATNKKGEYMSFNIPDKTEKQAMQHAKDLIRYVIKERAKKRPYGWKYKVK